jgi:hypothetical protein
MHVKIDDHRLPPAPTVIGRRGGTLKQFPIG